ncbi:MAG: hypothetical protein KJ676_01855 [Alphaproteobacteria bacterium]|nr:hypothetical protein [Alphaproteobacteria bacterium]MBU1524971.1 hypothetical protein [Alphaproteobacteria bacterium]MBU2117958.1 hypothetical protein [Alphaproteobacteria bacterium]MBU2350104.1 hypothetical protein [Alphaproteobacteria bacterium]MBU2381991.1 hypothetical protein [Alphaproteobacteria bacterium]
MTQAPPPTQVDDIVVRGQRRWPNGQFPVRSGEGYGEDPEGPIPIEIGQEPDPPTSTDPCASPETALDWNADAAAAEAVKDLRDFARSQFPNEQDFNDREYGAVLWEMPDGSIIHGPMRAGEHTFYEASGAGDGETRAVVELDWTPPGTGAVIIGTVHTHNVGGFLPSGSSTELDDQGVLTFSQQQRESLMPGSGSAARLYVAAHDFGSYEVRGPLKITVYDSQNRQAAIAGIEGPEVNPEGQPCP